MTTARIKHRDYVPYGWLAIEFFNIEFFGDNAKIFRDEWYKIEFSKYGESTEKIELLENKKKLLEKDERLLKEQLKSFRRWWKFWKNKREKQLWTKIFGVRREIKNIDKEIDICKKNRFYSSCELVRKAERFLSNKGFALKNGNSAGSECITYTDIWEL